MTVEPIATVEELAALPLGQWIFDADGEAWALFDTDMMVRQRMWRNRKGYGLFVAHEGIALPAELADVTGSCEHPKLNREGWQCEACAAVINEPPPLPEPVVAEKGRAWFYSDAFGDWCGMSPDFDNIVTLAEDAIARPHDRAASDRLYFEMLALTDVLLSDALESTDVQHALTLIIRDLVARNTEKSN